MFNVSIDKNKIIEIEERVKKSVKEILNNKDMLNEIGKFTTDRIRYQARIKKPATHSGTLPPLADSTIKGRRYLQKFNATHETFEPTRSNLTITGELLDSLTHFVRESGKVVIKFIGIHERYRSASGPMGTALANSKIAEYLKEKGFLAFDDSIRENETFVKRIRAITLAYIRRGLRVRNKLGP